MTHEDVQRWLDAYIAAWRSNDPEEIERLFTPDATYAYSPWRDPLRGSGSIVEAWLADADAPDTWKAEYAPLLVEGARAVTTGTTVYLDEGKTYSNMFVLRFDGDRCAEFVDWYMEHPAPA